MGLWRLHPEETSAPQSDRADVWTKTVVEWLERIADQSKRLENDPACGCMPEPKVGSNGLVNLMLDRISMLVPFERGRGHIDFPTLGLSVRAKDIQQLFRKTYSIPRRHVPRYLLFLADADATIFQGRFRPYVPQRLEVEGSARVRPTRLFSLFAGLGVGVFLGIVFGESEIIRHARTKARTAFDDWVQQARDILWEQEHLRSTPKRGPGREPARGESSRNL